MFARDVITKQVLENHLLEEQVMPAADSMMSQVSEELTKECAEEFEQACQIVAPIALLSLPDLQVQFHQAMMN